jgi:hypothetical protein
MSPAWRLPELHFVAAFKTCEESIRGKSTDESIYNSPEISRGERDPAVDPAPGEKNIDDSSRKRGKRHTKLRFSRGPPLRTPLDEEGRFPSPRNDSQKRDELGVLPSPPPFT